MKQSDKLKNKMKKKGQITLFVILGIIIITLAVVIYLFYPEIKMAIAGQVLNPSSYLQECMGDELKTALETASIQGGSLNPEHYMVYKSQKIEYLCYTNEDYKPCIMQQPMLKNHIETELEKATIKKVDECLDSLEQTYRKKGYEVEMKRGAPNVELLPKKVMLDFNSTLTLKKENTQRYADLKMFVSNNLYELVSIAVSILGFETNYGDSETTIYMNYYHNLKVEKIKQEEGSKIYIITERSSGNKLQFATRSIAWPPAY